MEQTWSGINVTFIGEQVLELILDEDEHLGWHDWVSTWRTGTSDPAT